MNKPGDRGNCSSLPEAAGFTQGNVLDVVLGVGQKTLSNYTNHIAVTELDSAFSYRAWCSPN